MCSSDLIKAITAVQARAKAGPQRVVALGSEPRQVQELHDVGSLESWGVVALALRVKHVVGPVRCQGRLGVWGMPRGRHGGDSGGPWRSWHCRLWHALLVVARHS